MRRHGAGAAAAMGALVAAGVLSSCSNAPAASSSSTRLAAAHPGALEVSQPGAQTIDHIVAPAGMKVTLWAVGGGHYSAPDAIDVDGQSVWVGYQNKSVKDGSDNSIASTVVEYTMHGTVVRTWSVPGHVDGLRVNPQDHRVWVTSNEDAAPLLNIIDPASRVVTAYSLQPTVHGGGYDDVEFVGGTAFVACSNPNLDANGNNVFPAIDRLTLSGTTATVSPVLMGNATANDLVAGKPVTLNLTDPDSLTLDSAGDLVLVSQADSALITIKDPGTPGQSVTRLPIGNQEDDTVWTTAFTGRLFVVDAGKNAIYTVAWSGPKGTIITEAPNDSGVVGFVGTIDASTGFITPLMTGWIKPTGLAFVPA